MTLTPGTRLGSYEIVSLLDSGGMGEVYKARDTRLDRSVALKVLLGESDDPERRARFEREARTIGALNHPNICTLHDVGVHEGAAFLVMELLAGQTLAERLVKGPLSIETALDVGAQIAEALAAAHRAGIVHRDLKPANVMLTKTGVKLLDFGLAKLRAHGERAAATGFSAQPTHTASLTERGTILGTLPYMAPEQVQGLEADSRTDLWALGAILYEMVAGSRAFVGSNPTSLIGAILERQPALLRTRESLTPAALDYVVQRCLAKSPDDRWDTAHDVVAALRLVQETRQGAPSDSRTRTSVAQRLMLLGTGVVLGGIAAVLLTTLLRPGSVPPTGAVIRTSLDVHAVNGVNGERGSWTVGGSRTALTWTPDGRSLVFVGRQGDRTMLYVRSLDRDQVRALAGTDGALAPAVSADGQWVAFWADGSIKKVPLAGGLGQVLESNADLPSRLAWSASNELFYDSRSGIRQLGPSGGRNLTRLEETADLHMFPFLLPGDRVLLYTVRQRLWTWGDEQVVAHDLSTDQTKVLLQDATDARYVPTGHLLFLRRGQLFAVPFDPSRVETKGTPVAVLDGVAQALSASSSSAVTGAGQLAVGATGTLAWLAGDPVSYPNTTLVEMSRTGQTTTLPAPARSYAPSLRVAPDGGRLAVTVRSLTRISLCVYDLARGTLTTLTNEGEVGAPLWLPGGRRLTFQTLVDGRSSLNWLPPDGSGSPNLLAYTNTLPSSWLPTGRQLAAVETGRRVRHLRLATIGDDGRATFGPPLPVAEPVRSAEFSPDGQLLAYQAGDPGESEVYLQPFPGPGPRLQVSTQGGMNPAWNPNGRELFFLAPISGSPRDPSQKRMMVVTVDRAPALTVGVPRQLFQFTDGKELPACGPIRCYDIAPDGQRFYAAQNPGLTDTPAANSINLIVNWHEELKRLVPLR